MERLPYVDEHAAEVAAAPDAAWEALRRGLEREFGGAATLARLLGCTPAAATTPFELRVGQTLPGFRVEEVQEGRRVALGGRHRFSTYRLTFEIDGGRLRARTHAAFPGLHGRLYGWLLMRTGLHRTATRRLLARIAAIA